MMWWAVALYGHIKTAAQSTIIQEHGDWYTGRWWVDCYIWYSEEGPVQAVAPPSPLLTVHWPLVGGLLHLVQQGRAWAGYGPAQSHPHCTKCTSVPTLYHLMMWHCNYLCTLTGYSAVGRDRMQFLRVQLLRSSIPTPQTSGADNHLFGAQSWCTVPSPLIFHFNHNHNIVRR